MQGLPLISAVLVYLLGFMRFLNQLTNYHMSDDIFLSMNIIVVMLKFNHQIINERKGIK